MGIKRSSLVLQYSSCHYKTLHLTISRFMQTTPSRYEMFGFYDINNCAEYNVVVTLTSRFISHFRFLMTLIIRF